MPAPLPDLHGKRCLVTGATGFIGSHLIPKLASLGAHIRALAWSGEPQPMLPDGPDEILHGDLLHPASIAGNCRDVEVVIHLAARVTDWGPRKWFYSSICTATRNLFEEADREGVSRFVFMSSVAACGVHRHLRGFREWDPCVPAGIPYGDLKLETEQWIREAAPRAGMDWTIVRPCNVTGPGSVWVCDPIRRMRSAAGLPLLDGGAYDACLVDIGSLTDGIIRAAFDPAGANQIFHFRDEWQASWRQYLTELGLMAQTAPRGQLPFGLAWRLGSSLERAGNWLGVRAPVTRLGAGLLGRELTVSTLNAQERLGWEPSRSYADAMARIYEWVQTGPARIRPAGRMRDALQALRG
ncbi:MAG: NAD-dependent epimerase/dehydratase family protein [Bacteroidia bacterium]|nr:NAD-dependent epimerase/dehydratase family protein [Bacteroidia bacterium]